MTLSARQLLQRGFTLVELLIVVIILAILAAIVIPQFNSATSDTQEAALDSNLAAMRNDLELYKAQHGNFPTTTASTGGTGCASPGVKGTGATDSAQAFIDQLTMYSDATGFTCSIGDTTYKYGPYLRKSIPSDPFKQKGSIASEITVSKTGSITAPTADTGGWLFDSKTGQLMMNSNAKDSNNKFLYTH